MDFTNALEITEYAFTLSIFYLISYDTIKAVSILHCKSNNGTLEHVLATLALCVCAITILNKWLQMLIIFHKDTDNLKKVVFVHHTMSDKDRSTKPKEEAKEEEEETKKQEDTNSTEDDKPFDEIK